MAEGGGEQEPVDLEPDFGGEGQEWGGGEGRRGGGEARSGFRCVGLGRREREMLAHRGCTEKTINEEVALYLFERRQGGVSGFVV